VAEHPMMMFLSKQAAFTTGTGRQLLA